MSDIHANVDSNETTALNDSSNEYLPVKNKHNLFKVPRVPSHENFSVTFQETDIENNTDLDLENSETFIKVKPELFKGDKSVPRTNSFLLENEASIQQATSIDKSQINESLERGESLTPVNGLNPFVRINETHSKEFSLDFEQSKNNLSDVTSTYKKFLFNKESRNSDHFEVSFNEPISQVSNKDKLSQEYDDTTSVSKTTNPFKRPADKSPRDPFQVDYDKSSFTEILDENFESSSVFKKIDQTEKNFDVTYNQTTSQKSSKTHEQAEESIPKNNNLGDMAVDTEVASSSESDKNPESVETIREEITGGIPRAMPSVIVGNTSLKSPGVSINSNKNLNAESYLNESSINDDNLKCWMSDPSDDENADTHLPAVSAVPSVISEEKDIKPKSLTKPEPKQATLPVSWIEKYNEIISCSKKKPDLADSRVLWKQKVKKSAELKRGKSKKSELPSNETKAKPPKLIKPASFVTKKLYQYLTDKLTPKYGVRSVIETEKLVMHISDTVKIVTRRKNHQKKVISDLKKELAKADVVKTTVDFHEFVIKFLPYSFRIKVVPSFQPITNTIYPPGDTSNPFDKIL